MGVTVLTMDNSMSHFAFYEEYIYIYTGIGVLQEAFNSAICLYFAED